MLSQNIDRVTFFADGATTLFPCDPLELVDKTNESTGEPILTIYDSSGVEHTQDYVIVGVRDAYGVQRAASTFSLQFETAPPAGIYTVIRTSSFLQPTELQDFAPWSPKTVEAAFDRQAIAGVTLWNLLQRTLRAPDRGGVMAPLPLAAARASKFLAFDSAGQPVVTDPPGGGGGGGIVTIPQASTTTAGIVRLATTQEAHELTHNDAVLTPGRMPVASDSQRGVVQLALASDAGNVSKALTPAAWEALRDPIAMDAVLRAGNSATPHRFSPAGIKLMASLFGGSGSGGGLNQAQVDARVQALVNAWALASDNAAIPFTKLTNTQRSFYASGDDAPPNNAPVGTSAYAEDDLLFRFGTTVLTLFRFTGTAWSAVATFNAGTGGGSGGGLDQAQVDARIRALVLDAAEQDSTASFSDAKIRRVSLTQAEYDGLTNKDASTLYVITDAPASTGSAGVQTDWNQTNTSDPSYLRNKPTLRAYHYNQRYNANTTPAVTQPNLTPSTSPSQRQIPATGDGLEITLFNSSVPGGILANEDFVAEYEGFLHMDLAGPAEAEISLVTTHAYTDDDGNSIAFDSVRTIRDRILAAGEISFAMAAFNARTQVPTGTFNTQDGTSITVTQDTLDRDVTVTVKLRVKAYNHTDFASNPTRILATIEHLELELFQITYYQLGAISSFSSAVNFGSLTPSLQKRLLPSPTPNNLGFIARQTENTEWGVDRVATVAWTGSYNDLRDKPPPGHTANPVVDAFHDAMSLQHTTKDVDTPWTATAPFTIDQSFSYHGTVPAPPNDTRGLYNEVVGSSVHTFGLDKLAINRGFNGWAMIWGCKLTVDAQLNGAGVFGSVMDVIEGGENTQLLVFRHTSAGMQLEWVDTSGASFASGVTTNFTTGTSGYLFVAIRPSNAGFAGETAGNTMGHVQWHDSTGALVAAGTRQIRGGTPTWTGFVLGGDDVSQRGLDLTSTQFDGGFIPPNDAFWTGPTSGDNSIGNRFLAFGNKGASATPGRVFGQVTEGTTTVENHSHIRVAKDVEIVNLVNADGDAIEFGGGGSSDTLYSETFTAADRASVSKANLNNGMLFTPTRSNHAVMNVDPGVGVNGNTFQSVRAGRFMFVVDVEIDIGATDTGVHVALAGLERFFNPSGGGGGGWTAVGSSTFLRKTSTDTYHGQLQAVYIIDMDAGSDLDWRIGVDAVSDSGVRFTVKNARCQITELPKAGQLK